MPSSHTPRIRRARGFLAPGLLAAAALATGPAAAAARSAAPPAHHTAAQARRHVRLHHHGRPRAVAVYGSHYAATAPPPSSSPLAGLTFWVDPNSPAAQQQRSWATSDPVDSALMGKIAHQPTAAWFGDWNTNITSSVNATVTAAAAARATPVLVAYDIPHRDCGGLSGGGATSPSAYASWIRGFAAGIGTRSAVVVLEPDALAGLDCLSAADQTTRMALLADAVGVLAAHPATAVYLDAGNAGWKPVSVIAPRLLQAGVKSARGFSLNVSNFDTTASETAYGQQISAATGGRHFVIDTSRNGNGSNGQWCNPAGRALGLRPTTATGNPLLDALLWIKYPGKSDGTCNGGPAAGTWWPAYAVGLAQRAAW